MRSIKVLKNGKLIRKKKKEISLRWGLIGIVVGCWLVPMLIIIIIASYYTSSSINRQFDEAIYASVSNAGYTARNAMQNNVKNSRYVNYEGSVGTAYRNYIETGDSQLLFNEVNSFLIRQYRFDDNILAAILFFYENPDRVYDTHNQSYAASYTHVIEYQSYVHEEAVRIAETLDTKIAFYSYNGGLYMIRNIMNKDYEPFAVLVLKLNTEIIFGGFESIVWQTGAMIYLNDTEIVLNESENLSKPDKMQFESGSFHIKDLNDFVIVEGRESIDGVDILFSLKIDRKSMMSGFDNFAGIFYLLITLLFPLLAIVIWYFYHNIFNPIAVLSSAARCIQNGQLGMKTGSDMPNKEFQYLNLSFNRMSIRLKQQFEQLYSEELALRDARIMALQSQINPHFLNNTLEIINWESRLGNNSKVSRMIEALATMLDAAMDRKNLPLIPLNQELMYLDAYLYIISERFGKRLTVMKEIDESLLQYKVPRLIMQPIAENAVEHGVSSLQKGEIIIRARKDESETELFLEAENNNILSPEDIEKINILLSPYYETRTEGSSLHLGIHNVNMRLKILYGGKAGLKIISENGRTVSVINIPLDDQYF